MKQEEKNLLLKDLCTRLPYGVKFKADNEEYIREIHYIKDENVYIREYRDLPYWIDTIKPYLRPMSSMTKEELKEFTNFTSLSMHRFICDATNTDHWYNTYEEEDWLNAHNFDYRGLIEKGLAIKVTEENNPYE